MDSEAQLIWGILFSSLGLGFFIYGKKQSMLAPLACGFTLMVYPYMMPNALAQVLVGLLLVAIPYFFRF